MAPILTCSTIRRFRPSWHSMAVKCVPGKVLDKRFRKMVEECTKRFDNLSFDYRHPGEQAGMTSRKGYGRFPEETMRSRDSAHVFFIC